MKNILVLSLKNSDIPTLIPLRKAEFITWKNTIASIPPQAIRMRQDSSANPVKFSRTERSFFTAKAELRLFSKSTRTEAISFMHINGKLKSILKTEICSGSDRFFAEQLVADRGCRKVLVWVFTAIYFLIFHFLIKFVITNFIDMGFVE